MIPHVYQADGITEILQSFETNQKVLYQLDTGGGKCLAKDTPIIMSDGSIQLVQYIKVGDFIMGDDSTPRKVLSLARGRENLYKINPIKGDHFTVNESHILSLKVTGIKAGLPYNGKKYYKGDVIDISVTDYLNQNASFKHCTKQYRVPLHFEKKQLPIDPYFVGIWLGDGSTTKTIITTMDSVIIEYLKDFSEKIGVPFRIDKNSGKNKSINFSINKGKCGPGGNPLLNDMKRLNLINNKHIPFIYKTSNREDRLNLLAGLIDSDGYLNKGASYDITLKVDALAEDVVYLCRSLGLAAYSRKSKKGCWYKGEYKQDYYNVITISGDCSVIPVKLDRNIATKRKQVKDVLVTGFTVEKLEEGNYYGFEIDGNRRFVLGDFTVTHNTVVFSFLSNDWKKLHNKKTLILCHREELVNQSCETLVKIGMTFEKILPKVKRYHHSADVYVAMVETLHRRLLKNPFFLKDVTLVICDEAHVQIFNKTFPFFPKAKILGVTATPIIGGRVTYFQCAYCDTTYTENTDCCGFETMEWSKPRAMSEVYQDIVLGPKIDFLIEFGQLVRELNFVKQLADLSGLKVDSNGEFSTESQSAAFNDDKAIFNCLANYEELCLGKRTIIFNSNTEGNKLLYDQFKEKGYNVRLFDSVNDTEGSRKELVSWFSDNDDAILLNVGVFVAGFDCKEVQAVILNCATMSLSKYLQMAGRGGRASQKIYKDHFILIDGGGNIDRFNTWSDPTRDWKSIFEDGIGKPKPKKESIASVKECEVCWELIARNASACPSCGYCKPIPEPKEPSVDNSILKPLDKIPVPNGEKIYKFTKMQGKDIHFAHKILIQQILELFILHRVSKQLYESTKANGKFDAKIGKMIRSCYFSLLGKKDIASGTHRTIKYITEKTKTKIENYYEKR